ncbi:hypothetical protein Tco_0552935 [Tanacetum coccineum]
MMDQNKPKPNWRWSGSDKTDKGFSKDTSAGQAEEFIFSLDWEVEEGECPHAPIATINLHTQGTQSQKVKTAEAVNGNQGQRKKESINQDSRKNRAVGYANLVPHVQLYADRKRKSMKKCIKDPIELHNIKQRDGESTENFVRRYKLESRDVKGAPEFMRISGFVHGIINPELIKRLHDKIPKTVDKMMRVTTSFLRGEVAASNHERKKSFPMWKQQEGNQKKNFRKGSFLNQQRPERKQDRFTLLTKTAKEIFALENAKFKAPPSMTTPVKKQNHAKFCEFHGENIGKEQPKAAKKGETSGKDKALAILMVQPLERVARQKITQSFSPNTEIFFPSLDEDEGIEGPMIIEAEVGGHCIHHVYMDSGSALEILYEHCFNQLRPKIKNQLVPTTTPLIGFNVVRSPSPYNGIIERSRVRKLQAVSSTVHEMLKISVEGGEEVRKLVEAGIMKEEHYHDSLSNLVMVKKHDGSWRMCVDFKDLNKACPKDGYPLPEIDWKVESLCGFPFKCFLDAYKGYH